MLIVVLNPATTNSNNNKNSINNNNKNSNYGSNPKNTNTNKNPKLPHLRRYSLASSRRDGSYP